jgi:hypothetical protein
MVTEEILASSKDFAGVLFKHENRASNSEAHLVDRSFVSGSSGRRLWLVQPHVNLCIPFMI